MEQSTALVRQMSDDAISPTDMISSATAIAQALARVIEKQHLASMISGRPYVRVEGWTTLAALRGCLPSERTVQEMEDGRYIAVVELRRADGVVLCVASGECGGPGERTWQQRPPYARRSMALTRATGKVCRIAFGWIMSLAGYETTPAEEMEGLGGGEPAPGRARKGSATPAQLDKLRELANDERLPEVTRTAIGRAIEAGMTVGRAGTVIAGAKKAIEEYEASNPYDVGKEQPAPEDDELPPEMR